MLKVHFQIRSMGDLGGVGGGGGYLNANWFKFCKSKNTLLADFHESIV